MHKTFEGLLDAHLIAGNAEALVVVTRLRDWGLGLAEHMDDGVFEVMLEHRVRWHERGVRAACEGHGARRIREDGAALLHRAILDPLLQQRDALTGLHANTQIPKAVGYAATGALTADAELLDAADFFWRTVVERRSVAIGGNSVREHFHDASDFTSMIEDREGPEFCNTYNMLKLTRALAEFELRPELLDFAERALYNHVLGSQHPDGGFVYFTPMRPRHYRVYSQAELGFWCCVGTGLEAQARTAEWIFGVEDDAIQVNLFVPSEARVDDLGVGVRIETEFPRSPQVRVHVDVESEREFELRLRVPGWSGGLERLEVNGESVGGRVMPGAIAIRRRWSTGDVVSFEVPIEVRAERLPDGSAWQTYLAGPVVLAARAGTDHLDGLRADDSRFGHIARGPLVPLGDLPLVEAGAALVEPQGALRYRVATVDGGEPIVLEPFAGIHDERYTVYWPVADGDPADRREQLRALDLLRFDDAATVDSVALGEQQPEADHAFRGADAETIVVDGRRWRVTTGTMTVQLRARGATLLRITCLAGDQPSGLTLRLGDLDIANEQVGAMDATGAPFDIDYSINELLAELGDPERAELSLSANAGIIRRRESGCSACSASPGTQTSRGSLRRCCRRNRSRPA